MANNGKFVALTGGMLTEETALSTSAGAGDANKIVKLNGSGKLDTTMMPTGIGPEAVTITTSEALAAGDFVNIWNSTGVKARKADATVNGKEAHGFVLAAAASGASATVYFDGVNDQLAGMTVGARQFLHTTAGARNETAPSATGNVDQVLGVAISASSMIFKPGQPVLVA
jgi:hypothetical protein